MIILAEDIYMP